MKVVIFSGLTISKKEVNNILNDAICLPPVKYAQLISVVDEYQPDVIGIVDGIIGTDLSVWHKEILYAIDKGVLVIGSAAMGAIRAAEMERFGMRGVGKVFENYKTGKLEDDDEVFIKFEHKDGYYLRFSEPMVNIRNMLENAVLAKIIDESNFKAIIEIAKSIHYTKRTFKNIYDKAVKNNLNNEQLKSLQDFASKNMEDLMKQDALAMLEEIANLKKEDIPEKKEDQDYSMLFASLYQRDRFVKYEDQEFPLYYISNYLCLYHPEVEDLNYNGLNRELVLYLAEIMKIKVNDEDINIEVDRFRKKYDLENEDAFKQWVNQNDLPDKDFKILFEKQALIRKMHYWFFSCRRTLNKNTAYLLEELKLRNEYPEWKEKTGVREVFVKDKEAEIIKENSNNDFASIYFDYLKYNKLPWSVSIKDTAKEMGLKKTNIKMEFIKSRIQVKQMLSKAMNLEEEPVKSEN